MSPRLSLPLLALCLAFAITFPGTAAASDASSLPPQGVYEQCGPAINGEANCLARLAQIREAGFDSVLNYTLWYASASQVTAYLDRANELGIQVIVPLNYKAWRDGVTDLKKSYSYLAPTCGCNDNAGFITYAIGLVKDKPATWGYYIGDENDPGNRDPIRALGDRVKALDPARPHLYIAFANQAQGTSNLAPYSSIADLVGVDYYPIGTKDTPAGLAPIAADAQGMADAAGKQSAVVLQAFNWNQYPFSSPQTARWPTSDEMRQMRDIAMANSDPRVMLWYSYNDVMRSDDPAGHWSDLRAAAFAPISDPDTSVVSGPQGTLASGDATFTQSSDLGSSFQCQLDNGAWDTCSNQRSYAGLADGPHEFAVRAVDRRGRTDQSPATRSWTIQRPAAPVSSPAPTTAITLLPTKTGIFKLGAIRISRGRNAKLIIHVPAAGKVTAKGVAVALNHAHAANRPHARRTTVQARSAGRLTVALKMHAGIRKALKRKHPIRLRLRVTFSPKDGGAPILRKRSVKLKP